MLPLNLFTIHCIDWSLRRKRGPYHFIFESADKSSKNLTTFFFPIFFFMFFFQEKFLERGIMIKIQLKVGNTSWGVRDLKCQNKLGEIAVLLSKCQLMGSPTEVMCQVK